MQRRAMGHDVKRLPRSVRAQFTNKPGVVKKRPSRKYRRRPKNLLAEYTRRQRQHVWLETHIWHAKRFHMTEKWGHKIPWKPTLRGERASYRASTRHCLIQDISYEVCLELRGRQELLIEGLSHMTNRETGQTFAAISCLQGTREGQTVLYHYDSYPWDAIGPVSFMWKPSEPIREKYANEATSEPRAAGDGSRPANQRQLWIWCHPACFDEVWSEILKCFQLVERGSLDKTSVENTHVNAENNKTDESKKDQIVEASEVTGNVSSAIKDKFNTDIIAINDKSNVQLLSLHGSILKFRMTGPESVAVLKETLQPINVPQDSEKSTKWWASYYQDRTNMTNYKAQCDFLETLSQCTSPSELPPHSIVAMTTRDPRMTRPERRTKVVTSETNINSNQAMNRAPISVGMSTSPLWCEEVRQRVLAEKRTDHQIHDLKADQLVRGQPLDLGGEESAVPVIVIQRPGPTKSNTGCQQLSGFDLLLPKGWAMPFWLALVYRGARCGGLSERESQAFEGRQLLFPNAYPDTGAGKACMVEKEKGLVEKYNRIPPAKRPNYTKLNVPSPFRCPWELLLRDWCERSNKIVEVNMGNDMGKNNGDNTKHRCEMSDKNVEDKLANDMGKNDVDNSNRDVSAKIFVLRSLKTLCQLQALSDPEHGVLKRNKKGEVDLDKNALLEKTLVAELNQSLVPVVLMMIQKGSPQEFGHICIPSQLDITQLEKDRAYGGPLEPACEDSMEMERLEKKKELKAKGINVKVSVDRTMKVLGEKDSVLVNNCSRDVIGFTHVGGYSLGSGNGGAMGYVSTLGLRQLLLRGPVGRLGTVVLLRCPTSLQYRFAKMSIPN
ncbi:ribonucleases P/MRP protein subunit POP1-like isoform X2 [Dreissena polymorpha]|nr:ribonucleases P/MRP protein subunit POP1-like isoform X2 [Dreissena polymorpha]XP_052256915.1 ribonucleases P/MRP protein subunit POP1-like isoform X2 [Dreissena polymorpha]